MKKEALYIVCIIFLLYLSVHSLFMVQTYRYLWEREEEYQVEILYITNRLVRGAKMDSLTLKQFESRYIISYPNIPEGYWTSNNYVSYTLKPKQPSKIDGSKILYILVDRVGGIVGIECTKP
jgi:hypothetical protein